MGYHWLANSRLEHALGNTSSLSLGDCYETTISAIRRSSALSAWHLFRLEPPFSLSDLGEIQVALRAAILHSEEQAKVVKGSRSRGQLRSSMGKTGERLKKLLRIRGSVEANRAFWVAAEGLCLADAVIRKLKSESDDIEGAAVTRLHGLAEGEIIQLYRRLRPTDQLVPSVLAGLRTVLGQCRITIQEAARLESVKAKSHDLIQAATLCDDIDTTADILGPMLSTSFQYPIETEDGDTVTAWAYTKVLAHLISAVTCCNVTCDCYLPTSTGDVLVAASSTQKVPGPPPKSFASRSVAKGRLQGGIVTETFAPVFNENPTTDTNSNHLAEGSPSRTFAIPIDTRGQGQHRAGQIFVAVYGEDAPRIEEMSSAVVLSLAIASSLGNDLGGRQRAFRWPGYLARIETEAELQQRIKEIVSYPIDPHLQRRSAFVVVSSHVASNANSGSMAQVLDNWAANTTLRLAGGETVYRLSEPGAYCFVRSDLEPTTWRQLQSADRLSGVPRIVDALCPNGKPAGYMGRWMVLWDHAQLRAAHEQLGERYLLQVVQDQIIIAARAVRRLNNLLAAYACGDYKNASSLAVDLVEEYGSKCGVAITDRIRLAIHRGDFHSALSVADARCHLANWDIEAHANRVMALLALGRVDEAEKEASECSVCAGYQVKLMDEDATDQHRSAVEAFPMQAVALALAQIRGSGSPIYKWRMDTQIEQALSCLAPSELEFRKQVRRLIDQVRAYCRNHLTPPLAEVDNALRDLDDVRSDESGHVRNWKEIESLRRIVVVLRGFIHHLVTSHLADKPAKRRRRASTALDKSANQEVDSQHLDVIEGFNRHAWPDV